ncbi:aldo/keto reductase [Beijerinckia indica]|uniref:Aldo/keto reductase n=1 Tax=Beijerinckia indica subsp. indica (strain ATCC 9039 / DSM 1715 / NCIMB 8712) TaxID=395963 RepID=B2IH24_BEII9|nr:aldo/keto reductase [Beijerinckia indica]ACB94438.1 aldo/keto reductase [Beijerinckia indica subsp. indica ATCC 9039]
MEKRKLGRSGLEIAPLVLGGNVFRWTADAKTSYALLDTFVDRGFNCVDTADVYSIWVDGHQGGESEGIIGDWLQQTGKRNKIVIATKVGGDMRGFGKGLSKEHILRSAEASLKRLKTDYIDLYQAHFDDPATPLEETLEAFDSLVKSGKVRAIGASNYVASRLDEALSTSRAKGFTPFTCLQPHYNLVNRSLFEGALQELCLAEGLGVIPYYALAAGFLTGKYRSTKDLEGSARAGSVYHYLDPRGLDILAELDKIAARLNASVTQISLAWLLAQKGVTAPIVSATSLAQLEDLMWSVDIKLDKEALRRLDLVSA